MEATSTLADALLDDLDDLSDFEEEEKQDQGEEDQQQQQEEDVEDAVAAKKNLSNNETNNNNNNNNHSNQLHGTTHRPPPSSQRKKRYLDDTSLQGHLQDIRGTATTTTATEEDEEAEEHERIVRSNRHLSRLATELSIAHGTLCAAYKPKFPELEELVQSPVEYCAAVRAIGNEMDVTRTTVAAGLNAILTSNQILTLSVSSSTTSGRPLTEIEMQRVTEEASYVERIIRIQHELTAYVESKITNLAPSVSALVGPDTAAQLIGLAGGLAELSKIPSCNLQVLGQVKHTGSSRAGMSSTNSKPHRGLLGNCDLVRVKAPKQHQRKALKTVAAKLALAARFDYVNASTGRKRSAATGLQFRQEIEDKIAKWQEPNKARVLKALPKPDLTIKKRRGGKRMRRLKERFEETALMKQANTRAFSTKTGEYGDDAMGLTMGLLDTSGADITSSSTSAVRKATEKRKMRYANTKASRKRAAHMAAVAGQAKDGASTSGMASSMVFTPAQGMELVDPDANKERVREANRKWFNDNAGFQAAKSKT